MCSRPPRWLPAAREAAVGIWRSVNIARFLPPSAEWVVRIWEQTERAGPGSAGGIFASGTLTDAPRGLELDAADQVPAVRLQNS